MTSHKPLSADLLLEHSAFLHGLARRLVRDEQQAEDVVQEAYLAVLLRPPPPHVRRRAWLAAVTRNLALRRRRGEGRRQRREGQVARPDGTNATADVAARVEAQRRIAEAVASLDEPGRSAIVWRYFDGLPPREIALREGVSVRTIESRLRRAREGLRAQLDAEYGGSRRVWCAVFIPAFGLNLQTTSTSSAVAATVASQATGTANMAAGVTAAAVGATIVSTKMIIGVGVVCAAAAFYAGRETAPPTAAPVEATVPETEVDHREAPALATADIEDRLARTQGELVTARQAADAYAQVIKDLRAELAASEHPVDPAGLATDEDDTKGSRFGGKRYKEVVSAVKWTEAGEAAAEMLPLLQDLAGAFGGGESVSDDTGIRIGKWNQELVKVAFAAVSGKLSGTGMNGAFTHPAVSLNLVAATLEHGAMPLDEGQRERLYEIGDRILHDDERRLDSYNDETFQLQKTIEECDLKDRMFSQVNEILTQEQRDLLHPARTRGRMGVDIFSSGVIYYTITKPVDFKTRVDLAESLVQKYGLRGNLTEEEQASIKGAAKVWAEGFSDAHLQSTADQLVQTSRKSSGGMLAGWQKTSWARAAAVLQLELNRALFELLRGDEDKMRGIRGDVAIHMPVIRVDSTK